MQCQYDITYSPRQWSSTYVDNFETVASGTTPDRFSPRRGRRPVNRTVLSKSKIEPYLSSSSDPIHAYVVHFAVAIGVPELNFCAPNPFLRTSCYELSVSPRGRYGPLILPHQYCAVCVDVEVIVQSITSQAAAGEIRCQRGVPLLRARKFESALDILCEVNPRRVPAPIVGRRYDCVFGSRCENADSTPAVTAAV